ncbi:MAG: ABC transporter ATP-binding protein [Candidatus Competibacteraceae bacterium]|nr:ABC transporter ATP-binding protein [Candidatus Competibacteraceae bacterium]
MSEPLFRLHDVHFGYPEGQTILSGVGFELDGGERIALAGSNGCGKTTLLHLMVGLHKPLSGEIHAFGTRRQSEKDFGEVRARAGLLFQDPDDQLFCPTVAEDVAFGPLNLGKGREEVHNLVHDTLAFLGLSGFADRITYKLSGGEKRLVALATVLAMQPDVLLLDEPTNALDAKNRDWLIEILRNLPQAMVIVSHDADFVASLATRTLHLEAGRLIEATPCNKY